MIKNIIFPHEKKNNEILILKCSGANEKKITSIFWSWLHVCRMLRLHIICFFRT